MVKYCENCGKELADNAISCPECGFSFKTVNNNKKNKYIASLLAFFLGGLGIHWFYLNRNDKGIIYLLCGTIGWLLIVPGLVVLFMSLIDSLLLWCKSDDNFNEVYN